MKHLYIDANGFATFVEGSDDTLTDMQTMVDGLIEYHPCVREASGMDCWVNEEGGLRRDFQPNLVASVETGLALRGSAVISRSNAEGETTGLTDEDVQLWQKLIDIDDVSSPIAAIAELHEIRKIEYRQAFLTETSNN